MYILIAVVFILGLLYLYGTRKYDFWEKQGVVFEKPIPFLGSVAKPFLQQLSLAETHTEIYKKYPKEPFVGLYIATEIGLLVRDPELVKRILVTDFAYFHPRGLNFHTKYYEPMMKNLFSVDGDTWKLLRQRLTPAFTSGKLKAMFPLIIEKAEKLQSIAADAAKSGKEVDIRDLMARYTTDFIGACGFGVDSEALEDENSTFRKLGRRIFANTKRDSFVSFLKLIAPDTFKYWHFFPEEVEGTTIKLVKAIMEQRDYKHSGRNDFIDLLLDLKKKGKIVGESVENRNLDGTPLMTELEMDDILMAAQVFIFFAAGFETSSSATSWTLHQLAFHIDEQRKCQEEIDEVLSRYDGKLSYEAVREMKYLEMCFRESMRLLPSLGFLHRLCARRYTIPGTKVYIEEGAMISIPIQALQTDEQYFDQPLQFRPERFHPDRIADMPKFVYLPFGEGPRACIGERLGLMQSIAGLASLLSQFTVSPSKSTLRHPIIDPKSSITQTIKDGVPLALVARVTP